MTFPLIIQNTFLDTPFLTNGELRYSLQRCASAPARISDPRKRYSQKDTKKDSGKDGQCEEDSPSGKDISTQTEEQKCFENFVQKLQSDLATHLTEAEELLQQDWNHLLQKTTTHNEQRSIFLRKRVRSLYVDVSKKLTIVRNTRKSVTAFMALIIPDSNIRVHSTWRSFIRSCTMFLGLSAMEFSLYLHQKMLTSSPNALNRMAKRICTGQSIVTEEMQQFIDAVSRDKRCDLVIFYWRQNQVTCIRPYERQLWYASFESFFEVAHKVAPKPVPLLFRQRRQRYQPLWLHNSSRNNINFAIQALLCSEKLYWKNKNTQAAECSY